MKTKLSAAATLLFGTMMTSCSTDPIYSMVPPSDKLLKSL